MIIPASVHILELPCFMITALGICPTKQKSLNFICCIQCVAIFFVQGAGKALEDAANICRVRGPALIDHVPENQHLTRAKDVSRCPIESAPVDSETKVTLALGSESSNG